MARFLHVFYAKNDAFIRRYEIASIQQSAEIQGFWSFVLRIGKIGLPEEIEADCLGDRLVDRPASNIEQGSVAPSRSWDITMRKRHHFSKFNSSLPRARFRT
jgi:hypothetical protein